MASDGLFSVALGVTHDDFDGKGLWLEVEVGGTAIVCQEIMPVPYALSLRPGATISGTVTLWSGLTVRNTASSGVTYGIRGQSDSTSGRGVHGWAPAGHGNTYGVYGLNHSTSGHGVHGYAKAKSGRTVGVWGQTDSSSDEAKGVYGYAPATSGSTYGVLGMSDSPDGYGVAGHAPADSGTTYGVLGQSDSPDGYGVYGENTANGYAGYFSGDVAQDRAGDGLVKATVVFKCDETTGTRYRYFNNVADKVTIVGYTNGECTIDFDFRVDDRFWSATAVGTTGAFFVRCEPHGSYNDRLICSHYSYQGNLNSGDIMVLVY